MGTCRNQLRSGRERIEKSGARGRQVEPPCSSQSEMILDQTRGGRKQHVGRDGGHYEGIDVIRSQPPGRHQPADRLGSHC